MRRDKQKYEVFVHSQRAKEIVCGLSCLAKVKKGIISNRLGEIERHLFHEDPAVWIVATWAFACVIDDLDSWDPSEAILNRLLSLWWLADADKMGSVGMAFESLPAIPRPKWKPALTGKQKEFLRHVADRNLESHSGEHAPWRIVEDVISSLIIAFHSADVFSDKELAERLFAIREKQRPAKKKTLDGLLSQFNEGQDLLRSADGPR